MPSNLLNADVGFPRLDEQESSSDKINKIVNYLYMLLEQLRYSFGNVDKDNFSEAGLSELEHMFTDPIYARIATDEGNIAELFLTAQGLGTRISDAEGNISTLTQTASALGTRISDAEGNISTLTQTADTLATRIADTQGNLSSLTQTVNSFSLSVSNGSDSSTITLLRDGIAVSSKVISFSGVVTFTDLSTKGATVINGGNITTGTISAIDITSCTITGGSINGAQFHNAQGNATLELGVSDGGYGDLRLLGHNASTGNYWKVFDIYDEIGSALLSIYANGFLRGSSSGVSALGNWSFSGANVTGLDATAVFG